MSGKWRPGLLPKQRVEEYARMLLGPYRHDNNVVSQATQTLLKMLNEQREMDVREGVKRAEARRDERIGLGEGQDGYIRPRRPAPSETSKALAGYGPDWKQRLAQSFFGKKMAENDEDGK